MCIDPKDADLDMKISGNARIWSISPCRAIVNYKLRMKIRITSS